MRLFGALGLQPNLFLGILKFEDCGAGRRPAAATGTNLGQGWLEDAAGPACTAAEQTLCHLLFSFCPLISSVFRCGQIQCLKAASQASDFSLAVRANETNGGNGGLGTNVVFVTHSGEGELACCIPPATWIPPAPSACVPCPGATLRLQPSSTRPESRVQCQNPES